MLLLGFSTVFFFSIFPGKAKKKQKNILKHKDKNQPSKFFLVFLEGKIYNKEQVQLMPFRKNQQTCMLCLCVYVCVCVCMRVYVYSHVGIYTPTLGTRKHKFF